MAYRLTRCLCARHLSRDGTACGDSKNIIPGCRCTDFDEPTAVLTPQEIEELIVIMRGLVREGKIHHFDYS